MALIGPDNFATLPDYFVSPMLHAAVKLPYTTSQTRVVTWSGGDYIIAYLIFID